MGTHEHSTTKYKVVVRYTVKGVVERSDIVGAIFGQTEGLLGDELDLRELQKSGRIGRIVVTHETENGLSKGKIIIPSGMDKVETAVLAAAIESVDRIGPCEGDLEIEKISDVREEKRKAIMERATKLLQGWEQDLTTDSQEITDVVKDSIRIGEIGKYGPEQLPAGPTVDTDETLVIVEGRADVLNLLRCGIKNCIAVQGTSVPKTVIELSKRKTTIAFLDGDRGGDMILNELLQVADVDYVARAPPGMEVEELTRKQLLKAFHARIPIEELDNKFNEKFDPTKKKASASQKAGSAANEASSSAPEGATPAEAKKPTKGQKQGKAKGKRKGKRSKGGSSSAKGAKKNGARNSRTSQKPKIEIPEPLLEKLKDMRGSNLALGFDANSSPVFNVGVAQLVHVLQNATDLSFLIFDGIVTQRIVDLSCQGGVEIVIGTTLRKVKFPPGCVTKFYSLDDF